MLRTHTQNSSDTSAPPELSAERAVIDDDPDALYERSLSDGWGDGMPLLPPTDARVRALLAATPYHPSDVIGVLPPERRECTIELAAINAAMAGCEPAAFPFVVAALEAICVESFNLFGLTTTTSSVVPMLIVNGPARDVLGIDYQAGCMGGAAGRGSMTIARSMLLCIRNVGGQRVGINSQSVFGQPARAAGLCFGEWEQRSPWATVAEQLGHERGIDVVTAHGGKGTHTMADINIDDAGDLVAMLAKSIAYPLGNKFLTPTPGNGQTVVAVNPLWADRFAAAFPDVDDLKVELHRNAWQPIDLWPAENREVLEAKGRVDDQGRVWLNERPDQFVVMVCGGLGNLHTIALPSWGESEISSQVVVR